MRESCKTVVKAEKFWSDAEAVAEAFEAGEDVVAKTLAVVNAPEVTTETFVEC